MTVEKSLSIKGTYDVAAPAQAVEMANVLKNYIVKQNLYTNIKGKNYAHVDGWQYAGSLMKTYPKVSRVENLSNEKEIKWKADVEIINIEDGMVVGFGTALCSNKEKIKSSFEEYAILSMAQTRAIGKAYRNRVGWIMKLAGYEATPAEEMPNTAKKETVKSSPSPKVVISESEEVCKNCDQIITKAEAAFSQRMFKKKLCRACQKKLKAQGKI